MFMKHCWLTSGLQYDPSRTKVFFSLVGLLSLSALDSFTGTLHMDRSQGKSEGKGLCNNIL